MVRTVRPDLLLAICIASMYGAACHLWQGHSFRQLVACLVLANLGFMAGHLAGELVGLHLPTVGRLHVIEGSLGSWALLFVVSWIKP